MGYPDAAARSSGTVVIAEPRACRRRIRSAPFGRGWTTNRPYSAHDLSKQADEIGNLLAEACGFVENKKTNRKTPAMIINNWPLIIATAPTVTALHAPGPVSDRYFNQR
jgi:hypothetical protein